MTKRPFELPQEARVALADLARLKEDAERTARQLQAEAAQLRATAETDLAGIQEAAEEAWAKVARDREALEVLVRSRVQGVALIAEAWADYERARAKTEGAVLAGKPNPAPRAAEAVRSARRELAQVKRQLKVAEGALAFYEFQFPWLTELRDADEENDYVATEEAPGSTKGDPARRWLSDGEYRALPPAKRNQLSLDRYLASRKSRWQIGRDYERYVGYLRERDGARVTYQGILAGLEDLGRDLICERKSEVEIVQCKCWAKTKTIHEKHIFQLFGSVVAMRIERPGEVVSGTFTTTTTLSERAHSFAEQLGIRVEQGVPLEPYPRIKCNVGREGERIYHLPFDQQYDSTIVEPHKGEFWAMTVEEAEGKGFRRAWRWHGAE